MLKKHRIKVITSRVFKLCHRWGFVAGLLLVAVVTIQAVIVRETQTGADLGQVARVAPPTEPEVFWLPSRLELSADEKDILSLIVATPGNKFAKVEVDLNSAQPIIALADLSLAESDTVQIERSDNIISVKPRSGASLADGQELIASLPVTANTPEITIPASAIKFVAPNGDIFSLAEAATFSLITPEAANAS